MRRLIPLGVMAVVALHICIPSTVADDIYAVRKKDGRVVLTNVPDGKGRDRSPGAKPRPARSRARPVKQSRPYAELVRSVAGRYGVDHDLVHAVIAVESNYDPGAVSSRGAVGLMQLMPETAHELGVHKLTDPHDNIVGGVRHLRRLLDYYDGDVERSIAAYNAGVSTVNRYGGIPPYRETRDYVRRVRLRYRGNGLLSGADDSRTIEKYVDSRGTIVFTQFPPSGNRAEPHKTQR